MLLEKAKAAKSAEELLALAKEHNVEMTADEAKIYFDQLNPKSGELDDDDLDAVAGGSGGCSGPTNSDNFPENCKVRNKHENCLRCGSNVWTAVYKYSPGRSGRFIHPTCDNCGRSSGCYHTSCEDMSEYYELI